MAEKANKLDKAKDKDNPTKDNKDLKHALSEIEKTFGKGSIMSLGSKQRNISANPFAQNSRGSSNRSDANSGTGHDDYFSGLGSDQTASLPGAEQG